MEFFKGRKAVIATKHKKEEVIAPILNDELGLICVNPTDLDTDKLGTFSGEIERKDDPITTLRNKCLMAIEATGINLAIANEGSFGVHPSIFLAHADNELIMLMDRENNIEIIERELSLNTNFNGSEIRSNAELIEFASKIGFPTHGIILKRGKDNFTYIIKDSRSLEELITNFDKIKNEDGTAYAETDMRAMFNPTRMKVIEQATIKLVNKAKSLCPSCGIPGFGIVGEEKGLPCELCGLPTKSIIKHIYSCHKCTFKMEKEYPFEKHFEDPQYCDFCNP
jgi:hypothetical protein